jgi:hypothetical protein
VTTSDFTTCEVEKSITPTRLRKLDTPPFKNSENGAIRQHKVVSRGGK